MVSLSHKNLILCTRKLSLREVLSFAKTTQLRKGSIYFQYYLTLLFLTTLTPQQTHIKSVL